MQAARFGIEGKKLIQEYGKARPFVCYSLCCKDLKEMKMIGESSAVFSGRICL